MKRALLVTVMACGGGDGIPRDSAADTRPPGPTTCTRPGPTCNSSEYAELCGNNAIDSCYWQPMPHRCHFLGGGVEACDGTARRSCADFGFLGGETMCVDCKLTLACEACAPGGSGCASLPGFNLHGDIAVSGSHVAAVGYDSIAVFDRTTHVTTTSVMNVSGLVGVAQGWLVATTAPPSLTPLDTAGALGTPRELPGAATAPVMAFGPGGRVLVAWSELVGAQWEARAALADASGNIIVAPATLFATDGKQLGVATDGASFFVGAAGKLARVASDGTFTVNATFPGPPLESSDVDVLWDGTTGWYLYGPKWAQLFDMTGAPVGERRSLPLVTPAFDRLARGNELLVLRVTTDVDVVRITPLGGTPLHENHGVAPLGGDVARFAYVGSELVVAWNAAYLRLRFGPK